MNFKELSKVVKDFMFDWPFYGHILMKMRRTITTDVERAAVSIDRDFLGVNLLINPDFWPTMTRKEQKAILHHEVLHIAFGHLQLGKRFPDQQLANIAMDLEINQFVDDLPDWTLSIDRTPFKEKSFAPKKGSKFYYDALSNEMQKDPEFKQQLQQMMQQGGGSDHSKWTQYDDLSTAEQKMFDSQQEHDLKEAVNDTGGPKSIGNLPGGLQRKLDDLFKEKPEVFNWKAWFRKYMGTILDIQRKKTPKRESKRFTGLPGLRTKKKIKIFVSIDVSGSVSMSELADVFEQIHHIWKAGAVIDCITWDTVIHDRFTYDGKLPKFVSGGGGSYIGIAIKEFNDKRKDYTAAIHFTDGHVYNDSPLVGRQLFIITSDGTIDWDPTGGTQGVKAYKMIQIPKDTEPK